MDDNEIIKRLASVWAPRSEVDPMRGDARTFLRMYREMQNIDHEIIGQKWVERGAWPRGNRPRR